MERVRMKKKGSGVCLAHSCARTCNSACDLYMHGMSRCTRQRRPTVVPSGSSAAAGIMDMECVFNGSGDAPSSLSQLQQCRMPLAISASPAHAAASVRAQQQASPWTQISSRWCRPLSVLVGSSGLRLLMLSCGNSALVGHGPGSTGRAHARSNNNNNNKD